MQLKFKTLLLYPVKVSNYLLTVQLPHFSFIYRFSFEATDLILSD